MYPRRNYLRVVGTGVGLEEGSPFVSIWKTGSSQVCE